MKPRVLLVNPPIYDFSAYDFWLKPYGLLSIGGMLRQQAALSLFDFLDRQHPLNDKQEVKSAMEEAHRQGVRVMLSEFSPLPGTKDGELCRNWADIDEPLWHNKTAFPIQMLGEAKVNALKQYCAELNSRL